MMPSDSETGEPLGSGRMRQKYKFEDQPQREDECIDDLNKLLDTQEDDLILAGELGKALLDKNEEISQQRETIVVEYSQKLEVLEQEKYLLRRQLEVLEDEYQQQVQDLKADIHSVKRGLEKQARKRRNYDKQSSDTISQMTEENQRLTMQVKQSGEKEKKLVSHKISVNTQFVVKKTSMQEHFNNMEGLNKKISEIVLAKVTLEKQIIILKKEIDNMTCSVEHSANKIRQMERKTKTQENTLRNCEKDCEKLRSANDYLLGRLEKTPGAEGSEINEPTNLLLEIECSVPDYEEINDHKDKEVIDEHFEEIDMESDEEICEVDTELEDLGNEVFSVYQQARNMWATLRRGKVGRDLTQSMQTSFGSSGSSEDVQSVKAAQLLNLLVELQTLLVNMVTNKCGPETGTCQELKMELEIELHQTKESIEQGELRLKQVELESKKELDKLQELKCKLSLVSTCLSAAEEETEICKTDLQNLTLSKEMMIKSAWKTRDEAVEVKNTAEVELAKNRIEKMQVSSQLMEAVQQKVSLSQELEEMEVNMQTFLQDQVKNKLDKKTCSQSDSSSESDSGRRKEPLSRKISRTFFGK
eukprot:GFUD01003153.1.p1 GENE.GFUD01003153.1~~GFUD01003153.1.p1  ORF type:complete len:587 (+),score=243.74 GFUD01003153.1:263-2023(+)